jgi:ABC-type sugar transport system permease subunit
MGEFRGESRIGTALVAPSLILLSVVLLIPELQALILSFLDNGKFVGLRHYRSLAASHGTVLAVINTLVFTVGSVAISVALGFAIALLLDRRRRARRLVRTVAIAPFVITPIVGAFAWKMLLDPNFGIFNYILTFLGVPMGRLQWASDPDLAMPTVIIAYVWINTPFVMLIVLAGLQNLPRSPFEAAAVDGAGRWFTFRRVLLPLIAPTLSVAAIFQCVFALREFAVIWVITQGGPLDATYVLSMDVYRNLFLYGRMGYSAAVGAVMLALTVVLTLPLVIRIVRSSQGHA